MLAVDWSHTKNLTTYDGKKIRVEERRALLKRLSTHALKSMEAIVLEQGCPLSLIYDLTRSGCQVKLIDNKATENYRKEYNIEKTDENDARIIYNLSNNGAKLKLVAPDGQMMQMHGMYHQYCRVQKARVGLMNQKKGFLRYYGLGESKSLLTSRKSVNPSPVVFDTAIEAFKSQEKALLKELEGAGGESLTTVESGHTLQPPPIKGLGKRIWIGLLVTANPSNFKCLSAYLRFCGLTDDVAKSHKYNRHARMLYHMLAEEIMKKRDSTFRPIYDKCKIDIATNHPEYTKLHIHNAALNRTATFLAKHIYSYGIINKE